MLLLSLIGIAFIVLGIMMSVYGETLNDRFYIQASEFLFGAGLGVILALGLIFGFMTEAKADEWKPADKALMGAFVAMQVIDTVQTKQILDRDGREENPLLGDHPSVARMVAIKGAGTYVIYRLADYFPEERRAMLVVLDLLQGYVIRHNALELHKTF